MLSVRKCKYDGCSNKGQLVVDGCLIGCAMNDKEGKNETDLDGASFDCQTS